MTLKILKIPMLICAFLGLNINSVFAQNQLISQWHTTDYSQARAHVLQTDQQNISLAVEIKIIEKFKTYWKSPGSTGVPPLATIIGNNIIKNSTEILFPHPQIYINKYGETWGYKDNVVLFVNVKRQNSSAATDIAFQFDYAVCDVICLPEHAEFSLHIDAEEIAKTMSSLRFAKFSKQISMPIEPSQSAIHNLQLNAENKLVVALNNPIESDLFITDEKNRFYQHFETTGQQKSYNILGLPLEEQYKDTQLSILYSLDGKYYHTKMSIK